jgi:chaperonin GroES
MSSPLAAPLHERLLVRRLQESDGDFLTPETAKRKPWKGVVLAVGNDKDARGATGGALHVKVGDKVLFGRLSGIEVKIDGEDLLVLPENVFLVVLT